MRIARLNLVRYGHFEGHVLEFPATDHDIHIVYGDNETGKSTALSALGDLLFGFGHLTDYDFRFDQSKLRVGARLEQDNESFEFQRRKGRGNTIVDDDGAEIADGHRRLGEMLRGADREFFERMFLLDHRRLESGTASLLFSEDAAGEALLATSAGIEGLHEIIQSLQEEADQLWSPNRSKKRAFYQAKDALDAAAKAKREAIVNTRQWRKTEKALANAQAEFDRAQTSVREKRADKNRLDRIRRVHGDINKLTDAEKQLVELGNPVLLPENALATLDNAVNGRESLQSRLEIYEDRIKEQNGLIEELLIDADIVARKPDIERLNTTRIQLQQGRDDLPRRSEERDALRENAARLIKELGWRVDDDTALDERLPARKIIEHARTLQTQHASLQTERRGLERARSGAEATKKRLAKAVKALPEPADLSPLRAAVKVAQTEKGVVRDRERADEKLTEAEEQLASAMRALAPAVESEQALVAALVPPRDTISAHRDQHATLDKKVAELEEAKRDLSRRVDGLASQIEANQSELGAMSDEDLADARQRRDTAWQLLADRYIRPSEYSTNDWQDLFGTDERGDRRYEELVAIADQGADTRFEKAHAVGELNTLERSLEELRGELNAGDDDVEAAQTRLTELDDVWAAHWSDCPVTPASPDLGLAWLDQHAICKTLLNGRDGLKRQLNEAGDKEQRAAAKLLAELKNVDTTVSVPDDTDLIALIELSLEIGQRLHTEQERAETLKKDLDEAEDALQTALEELADNDSEIRDWDDDWKINLNRLNLSSKTTPEEIASYLELIDNLRECHRKAEDLQHNRIDKIERDIRSYESEVSSIVEAVARDLAGEESDEVVIALVQRLQKSEKAQENLDRAEGIIRDAREKIDELVEARQGHEDTIAQLKRLAQVKDDDALREAVVASNSRRKLETYIEQLEQAIEANGDSKSLEELRDEAADADLDAVIAEAQSLTEELEALEQQMLDKRAALTDAQAAFDAIGVESDAAAAESARQQAIAEMEYVAERFVRVATAHALLQWSIDRFRLKNQKPMLDRASALFKLVTGGSFERVVIEYDGDDSVLAGRRPSGEITSIGGMSSGARDQLYMALRLAAIEDYAERATAMPFVGDDLFIQHDKKRTANALKALHELSKRCQVILFSLDEAFVEVARGVLQEQIHIVTLDTV